MKITSILTIHESRRCLHFNTQCKSHLLPFQANSHEINSMPPRRVRAPRPPPPPPPSPPYVPHRHHTRRRRAGAVLELQDVPNRVERRRLRQAGAMVEHRAGLIRGIADRIRTQDLQPPPFNTNVGGRWQPRLPRTPFFTRQHQPPFPVGSGPGFRAFFNLAMGVGRSRQVQRLFMTELDLGAYQALRATSAYFAVALPRFIPGHTPTVDVPARHIYIQCGNRKHQRKQTRLQNHRPEPRTWREVAPATVPPAPCQFSHANPPVVPPTFMGPPANRTLFQVCAFKYVPVNVLGSIEISMVLALIFLTSRYADSA